MTHLDLLMLFVKRILEINQNGSDMCDGVSCMNLIIAILENMQGMIDDKMPQIVGFLTNELSFLQQKGSDVNHKNFKTMILQAFAMCFSYNASMTFHILESTNMTLSVFQAWFTNMNNFQKDFEIRRVIFGLTAIIKTASLPDLVNQKLPDVMNQVTLLCAKMNGERLDVLKDNEKFIARGGKDESESDSDDEEAIDADGDDEDFDSDSEEEWKKQ